MRHKKLIIALLGFLIVIPLFLLSIFSNHPKSQPIPTNVNAVPTPIQPPVKYKPGAMQKAIDLVDNKHPLTSQDEAIKHTLIVNQPEGKSVYASPNVYLFYVTALDKFEAEIETIDVATAKKEANNWLLTQGMSQNGICNLPLTFYLNYTVAQKLHGTGFIFDPLPDGCN